jgi:hypothetical protein
MTVGLMRKISLVCASALVIALSGCGQDWTAAKIAESQRRGNEIVAALERFRANRGEFPKELEELVPDYVAEIIKPVAGSRKWCYARTPDAQDFCLLFGRGDHCYPSYGFQYRDKEDGWTKDE